MDFTEQHGPPHTWPTLAELAVAPSDLWKCPHCGCKDWEHSQVDDSRFRKRDNCRKRIRLCRNCKTPLRTQEVPVPQGHKLIVIKVDEEDDKRAAS